MGIYVGVPLLKSTNSTLNTHPKLCVKGFIVSGFGGARRLKSTFEFSEGLSLVPIQVKQVKGSW